MTALFIILTIVGVVEVPASTRVHITGVDDEFIHIGVRNGALGRRPAIG